MFKHLKNQRGDILMEPILLNLFALFIVLLFPIIKGGFLQSKENSSTSLTMIGLFIGVGFVMFLLLSVMYLLDERKEPTPADLHALFTFMIRKKPKKLFKLVKQTNESQHYNYSIAKYDWFLIVTTTAIDMKMNRCNKTVFHMTYDKKTESFLRKNLKASLFIDQKLLQKTEKFITMVLSTKWDEPYSFHFIQDIHQMDQLIPLSTPSEQKEHRNLSPLEEKMDNNETNRLFTCVINQLNALQDCALDLDIETKHLLEVSLKNDVDRLLSIYKKLNDVQKEMLADDMQQRLYVMNATIKMIQEKLDEKNMGDAKRMLHLLDVRYKG